MTTAPHPSAAERTLLRRRLTSQHIAPPLSRSPVDLVRAMGAVQAQDYAGGLWGIGLRVEGAVEADVERAIADATLVRSWPMRRTLHLVAGEDLRWMLRLLAPRQLALSAGRHRQLGLAEGDFARARRILSRALRGGRRLTRAAAYDALRRGGVAPEGQRGIHVLADLAQQGVLCFGPREGRQPTFVLLEEWLPPAAEPSRDEALATLAARYFGGHGPATLQDFVWWSGLRVAETRRAIEAAGARLAADRHSEVARYASADAPPPVPARRVTAALLPPWDESLVGYRDRSLATRALAAGDPNGLALIGKPLVLVDGTVRGAWRRELRAEGLRVTIELWSALTATERRAVRKAAARYGSFLAREVEIVGLGGD
ncbi:MAG TPA: winged helix DNA-binding domain-containing protein [Thermoanaerobaculia bacterium]|nr:winged helix DNA-binding domain-containing protein [Thermoanaerobaculia bacterium]